MEGALSFLLVPTVLCLILVGIHCYLGLHVLARGVIFVDLSLAQVAAFGTVVAYLFGFEHDQLPTYLISLSCTLLAGAFLSFSNRFHKKISQEAIIGVLYALFSGLIVILLDKMSHGSEHLKYALVGQMLWVTWTDVLKVLAIYAVVGAVHYIFRERFLESSFKSKGNWFWDFIFYALFGVVITSSVHVAGVLLVFAFLVVPALVSGIFTQSLKGRLLSGWAIGFILCLLGIAISYWADLPSGAVIVVTFTSLPVALLFLMPLLNKSKA